MSLYRVRRPVDTPVNSKGLVVHRAETWPRRAHCCELYTPPSLFLARGSSTVVSQDSERRDDDAWDTMGAGQASVCGLTGTSGTPRALGRRRLVAPPGADNPYRPLDRPAMPCHVCLSSPPFRIQIQPIRQLHIRSSQHDIRREIRYSNKPSPSTQRTARTGTQTPVPFCAVFNKTFYSPERRTDPFSYIQEV